MCARRTDTSTITSSSALVMVITFKRRSITILSVQPRTLLCPFGLLPLVQPRLQHAANTAIVLQNIDEDAQQHVHDIVNGLKRGDGRLSGSARAHGARHF